MPMAMQFLKNIDRVLKKSEIALLVLIFGALVILAFAQVVARNLLGSGFSWGDIVVRQLVVWAGFLGAAIAASENRHLNLSVVEKILSPRMTALVGMFTKGFAMLVCLYFARESWIFVMMEKASGEEVLPFLSVWLAAIIIPVGYALLAFHFLIKAVEDLIISASQGKVDEA